MLKKTNDISGTSLQGYLNASYDKIVKVLGEPHENYDDGKIDAEWNFKINSHVVTLYNYKDGKNYLGSEGADIKDITIWHIGGHDKRVLKEVKKLFTDNEVVSFEDYYRGLLNKGMGESREITLP